MIPPVKLFGPKWVDTPIWEACETVPTPVGSPCFSCGSEILVTQSGVLMWDGGLGDYQPWHRLCFLMPILGELANRI